MLFKIIVNKDAHLQLVHLLSIHKSRIIMIKDNQTFYWTPSHSLTEIPYHSLNYCFGGITRAFPPSEMQWSRFLWCDFLFWNHLFRPRQDLWQLETAPFAKIEIFLQESYSLYCFVIFGQGSLDRGSHFYIVFLYHKTSINVRGNY